MGIDGKADTRCHSKLMGVNEEGLTKTVNDLPGNLGRVVYALILILCD
jgi:hypothetical protein